ncbi:MAG TPA: hypothetical protein GXX28_02100, partial [Firmicutes bacterium]|nr:hypothetical protein [Bacillota bacterium]
MLNLKALRYELERVLRDYPAMKANLENLVGAEEAFNYSLDRVVVAGGEMTSRVERLAIRRVDYARAVGIVEAVYASLPDQEKEFVRLRYFEDRTLEETSLTMEVSEKTAYR